MAAGMDALTATTNENLMEVKNTSDKDYTISNTLTKMTYSMDMLGQSKSYDSEKKEDRESETGKSLGEKLNKLVEVTVDRSTGAALSSGSVAKKEDGTSSNAMMDLISKMGENSTDEAVVGGAFVLIPAGIKSGDSWSDSTIDKDLKIVRKYILRSVADTALVTMTAVMENSGTMDMMGMSVDVSTTTQTNTEIVFDPVTALVKRKNTEANLTGSFQVMGQTAPISAKAITVTTYQ
jgi:hypothetical protein